MLNTAIHIWGWHVIHQQRFWGVKYNPTTFISNLKPSVARELSPSKCHLLYQCFVAEWGNGFTEQDRISPIPTHYSVLSTGSRQLTEHVWFHMSHYFFILLVQIKLQKQLNMQHTTLTLLYLNSLPLTHDVQSRVWNFWLQSITTDTPNQ